MTNIDRVVQEASVAQERYGGFTSTHEALGVLMEEVRELEDAIRSNSMRATAKESMQVAAVALRLFEMCEQAFRGDAPKFKTRSGA